MAGIGFVIVALAVVATGWGVARWLYRNFDDEEPSRVELAVAAAVAGAALWIAASWILAIALLLTRRNLAIVAILFFVAGAASIRLPRRGTIAAWSAITFVAIAAWCGFALWRGSVVPPATHDALVYHLPKAAMIVRAGGYTHFDVPDPRIREFPSNYELLLADVILLTGSDRLTEWIGTASYLLFLGMVALFARRWYGAGIHTAIAVLAAAGAPLLLLHSAHDKNDLMTAAFAAGALYWSAKWCVRRCGAAALLAIACGALAAGTKLTVTPVILAIAPFGIVALLRKPPRLRAFAAAIAFAAIVWVLCGGWVFLANLHAAPARAPLLAAAASTPPQLEWRNLWFLPLLIVRVSLGLSAPVPWAVENVFASHFGFLFGLALLALPFSVWRYRGHNPERSIASWAATLGFFALLPFVESAPDVPQGVLRYGAFILPIVLGWTVAPVMRELTAKRPAYAHGLAAGLLALFCFNAIDMATNDTFTPIEYTLWCAAHPGTRSIFWSSAHAASVVDQMAGPRDEIAMVYHPSGWVYPAYGRALTRPVVFVHDDHDIPAQARWVIIDAPPAKPGQLTPDDLRVTNALRADPRFALVYRNDEINQAVFRRR